MQIEIEFMPSKYINPFTDFGFKRIFGTEENKDILLDFLNTVMVLHNIQIQDLTYKKTDLQGKTEEDRITIFDLYCQDAQGKHFTIELQNAKQSYFKDRMVFYSSRVIQNQGLKGIWDYRLDDVYLVALMNFKFDKRKKKVISSVKLLDLETYEVFYEKLGFVTVELPKFDKNEKELETNLDKWLYILKNMPDMETIPDNLKTDIFEKVFKISEYVALSVEEKEVYEESLKHYNDMNNSINTAVSEKTEELQAMLVDERKQKEEERKLKEEAIKNEEEAKASLVIMIKGMIENGFELEKIAKMLGKSQEEINEMLK